MTGRRITRKAAVAALASGGAYLLVSCGLPAFWYAAADPIEKTEIDTRHRLAEYGRTGDAQALYLWVTGQHNALFMAANYTLGEWALKRPNSFASFLDELDAAQMEKFSDGFAWVVADSGMDERFRGAFRNHRSARLAQVVARIPKLEKWQGHQSE